MALVQRGTHPRSDQDDADNRQQHGGDDLHGDGTGSEQGDDRARKATDAREQRVKGEMVQLNGEEHHSGSDPSDGQADPFCCAESVRLRRCGSPDTTCSVRRERAPGLRSSVMQVRRVVTGHDANGKAVVASDTEVDGIRPAMTPGSEFHRLWGADEAPHLPRRR